MKERRGEREEGKRKISVGGEEERMKNGSSPEIGHGSMKQRRWRERSEERKSMKVLIGHDSRLKQRRWSRWRERSEVRKSMKVFISNSNPGHISAEDQHNSIVLAYPISHIMDS